MIFTLINQHYLHRINTMYKICYEIKYAFNDISKKKY